MSNTSYGTRRRNAGFVAAIVALTLIPVTGAIAAGTVTIDVGPTASCVEWTPRIAVSTSADSDALSVTVEIAGNADVTVVPLSPGTRRVVALPTLTSPGTQQVATVIVTGPGGVIQASQTQSFDYLDPASFDCGQAGSTFFFGYTALTCDGVSSFWTGPPTQEGGVTIYADAVEVPSQRDTSVVIPYGPTETVTIWMEQVTPSSDPTVILDETLNLPARCGGEGAFEDDNGSIFENEIDWLFENEVSEGCNPEGTRFCPNDFVTRGQMAAFLARTLGLAPGGTSEFTDDNGSIFESDIAAIAADGITEGCNPEGTLFCPDDLVTRGQMAAFIRRSGFFPPAATNPFTDTVGSVFEDDIAAIAAGGITLGCNPEGTLYCPDDFVTRGQMAAFLFRGFEDVVGGVG